MIIQLIDIGKKQIKDEDEGVIYEYNGEILDGDKATGYGEYSDPVGNKYSGHFINDMVEGECESNI